MFERRVSSCLYRLVGPLSASSLREIRRGIDCTLSLSLFLIVSISFSVYLSFSHKSFALLHNCNLSRRSDLLVSEESRRVLSPSSNYSYISALFLLLVESPGRRKTKNERKTWLFFPSSSSSRDIAVPA